MSPKRVDEIPDGGSIYWVIKGEIAAREKDCRHRAVSRQGRHRTLPPCDGAETDFGVAAADAAVPGLALSRSEKRAA
jgi:hypothetical protein